MNGTGALLETLENALTLSARQLSCGVAFGILMYLIPTLRYPHCFDTQRMDSNSGVLMSAALSGFRVREGLPWGPSNYTR